LSKKTDNILLLPGASGWELWQGSGVNDFRKVLENGPVVASEIEKIPSGLLTMGFPVREALAIPFKVQTDDASMFDDLAAMQLEKIGVHLQEDAGQLMDVFLVGGESGATTLLAAVLAPPVESTMPRRSPKQFDLSPRFFPMEPNTVTFWCELGRWVFAVTCGEKLTYFQSLPGTGVTGDAVRDVRLALNQLKLQGVDLKVERAVVWLTDGGENPSEDQLREYSEALGLEMVAAPKPLPVMPDSLSKLLPADIRAEQRKKAERMKMTFAVAVVLLMYFGMVSYFAVDYWKVNRQLKAQEAELDAILLEHGDIGIFNDQWEQLQPVVDSKHWPLTVLKRVSDQIPARQDLRFKVFDAKYGEVSLRGEATNIKLVTAFSGRLRRMLPDYDWNTPPADADAKTEKRVFNFSGVLKGSETE